MPKSASLWYNSVVIQKSGSGNRSFHHSRTATTLIYIAYYNAMKALVIQKGALRLFVLYEKGTFMKNNIKTLTLSAMFLAVALTLPFLTGQIPEIGAMLCPMHLPVLLCGFFCGAPWGLAVGLIAPLLRSMLFGMPPMFPTGLAMAFELAAYGAISSLLYARLPKTKWSVYTALVTAMVVGRLVWGAVRFLMVGLDITAFGLQAFWAGAVTGAIPGILLQLVLIPILVLALDKQR